MVSRLHAGEIFVSNASRPAAERSEGGRTGMNEHWHPGPFMYVPVRIVGHVVIVSTLKERHVRLHGIQARRPTPRAIGVVQDRCVRCAHDDDANISNKASRQSLIGCPQLIFMVVHCTPLPSCCSCVSLLYVYLARHN